MSVIRLVAAVLIATAAAESNASASLADLSHAAIDSCMSTLRGSARDGDRSGSDAFDLAKSCPELARELESLDERNSPLVKAGTISGEGLRDLEAVVRGFRLAPDERTKAGLDFEGLHALLDDVLIEEKSGDSLWSRLRRWLEQHFHNDESPRLQRFLDWLESLDAPPWLGDVLIKASTVLIVVLALIFVGNELRLAGILRRARRAHREPSRAPLGGDAGSARALSFAELRGLPPRALAGAILEMVTAAFAERGWLARSASLTSGELLRQVERRESAMVSPFSALLRSLETIVYGDREPDEEGRRQLIAAAGALLAHARRPSATEAPGSR